MMKTKIKYIRIFIFIFILAIICFPSSKCFANEKFTEDEEGIYHITSLNDWNLFIEKSQEGEDFSNKTVLLETDLDVIAKDFPSSNFLGTFDGNGHLITFMNDDITSSSAVFPLGMQGTLKNINIYVKDCIVDATKHNGNVTGTILATNGGTMFTSCVIENINIYGTIKVILDLNHDNSIECSGIGAGFSALNNCYSNIIYDIDERNINDFLANENKYGLKLRLSQIGSKLAWKMASHNCLITGGYSDIFIKTRESIDRYYNSIEDSVDDQFVLIVPFGGEKDGFFASSVDNCYCNQEIFPIFLCGKDSAKNEASLYYLTDDSMLKSTEDLKKQETFIDYDFENVWGISEYINDGYPYLQALVSKDLIALVDQIAALPKGDEITKDSKEAVERLKEALAGLSDQEKAMISFDALSDKVTKAEEAIKAIEEKEKEDSNSQPQEATTISVEKGTKFAMKGYKYTVTGTAVKNPTVLITGYKNKKLKKITIPATVTYKGVKFTVTAIGNKAFKGQKKATTATIGTNVTSIGKQAFNGDAKIKKITIKSAVLKKVGAKAFKGIHKKAVIKVPKKQLKAYKKLMKGKGQAKTVKIK